MSVKSIVSVMESIVLVFGGMIWLYFHQESTPMKIETKENKFWNSANRNVSRRSLLPCSSLQILVIY